MARDEEMKRLDRERDELTRKALELMQQIAEELNSKIRGGRVDHAQVLVDLSRLVIVMTTTFADLIGKTQGLGDSLTAAESRIKVLEGKVTSTTGGVSVAQADLDTMGTTLDGLKTRVDDLAADQTPPDSSNNTDTSNTTLTSNGTVTSNTTIAPDPNAPTGGTIKRP